MKKIFGSINESDYIEKEQGQTVENSIVFSDVEEESVSESWLQEIKLYDPCKSREENFRDGSSQKYLLFSVEKNVILSIERRVPDRFWYRRKRS